jgi:hypothetical protein
VLLNSRVLETASACSSSCGAAAEACAADDELPPADLMDPTPPWALGRLQSMLHTLAADLIERVDEDAAEHRRHPTVLGCTVQLYTCTPSDIHRELVGAPVLLQTAGAGGSLEAASGAMPPPAAAAGALTSMLLHGGVVSWPVSRDIVDRCRQADTATVGLSALPRISWSRPASALTRFAGQMTSRTCAFPVEAASAALPLPERKRACLDAVARLYLAAVRAAAEADGWVYNGVVSRDIAAAESGRPSAAEPLKYVAGDRKAVDAGMRQLLNRFTIPLSVVKLGIAATQFAAGPPSMGLRGFFRGSAPSKVGSFCVIGGAVAGSSATSNSSSSGSSNAAAMARATSDPSGGLHASCHAVTGDLGRPAPAEIHRQAIETEKPLSATVSGVQRLRDTGSQHIGVPTPKRSRLAAASDAALHADDLDAFEASEPQLLASDCAFQGDIPKGAVAATATTLRSGRPVRLSDVLQMETVLRRVVSTREP